MSPTYHHHQPLATAGVACALTAAAAAGTLSVEVIGPGSVAVDPPGTDFPAGTEVTLTATPDAGKQFVNFWVGETSSENAVLVVTAGDGETTVEATFADALDPDLFVIGDGLDRHHPPVVVDLDGEPLVDVKFGWRSSPVSALTASGTVRRFETEGDGMVLPGDPAEQLDLSEVVALSSGAFLCFALRQDGTVTRWELRDIGERYDLGVGRVSHISGGDVQVGVVHHDGSVSYSYRDANLADLPPPVPLVPLPGVSDAVATAVAIDYLAVLHSDGSVSAHHTGFNSDGAMLPPASIGNGFVEIDGAHFSFLAIRPDRSVVHWGSGGGDPFFSPLADVSIISAPHFFGTGGIAVDLAGRPSLYPGAEDLSGSVADVFAANARCGAGGLSQPGVRPYGWAVPGDMTVEAEGNLVLRAYAYGSPPLAYEWRKDGEPVAGGERAFHFIDGLDLADSGRYSCVVSNAVARVEIGAGEVAVRLAQAIDFPALADRPESSEPFAPGATASSGNAVAYEIVSGPAVVEDGFVRLTGGGEVTVRATSGGDDTYLAAPPAERTFLSGLELTLPVTAGGTVSADPDLPLYRPGQSVTLTASAEEGYAFTGWEGDGGLDPTSPVVVELSGSFEVSPVFRRVAEISLVDPVGGTLSLSPERPVYFHGDAVAVIATPAAGWSLVSVEREGGVPGLFEELAAPYAITLDAARPERVRAEFQDAFAPSVEFSTPADGAAFTDERFAVAGSVSDNVSVEQATVTLNGVDLGEVALGEGGTFELTYLPFRAGPNTLEVRAVDNDGNASSASLSLIWEPLRVISFGPASLGPAPEGHIVEIPIRLAAGGDVSGLTFVARYPDEFLTHAASGFPDELNLALGQVNASVPGEIRFTLSRATETFPPEQADVAYATFRVRSLPEAMAIPLTLQVLDASGSDGSLLPYGTGGEDGAVPAEPRGLTGDANNNGQFDTGDSTLLQRLLTELDPVRPWDVPLNDLNSSGSLDSGDITKVLRAVVGLDPQPGPGGGAGGEPVVAQARANAGAPLPATLSPVARTAPPGETWEVEVGVAAPGGEFSGASFRLEYPPEALRLVDASAHAVGPLVPSGAFAVWNVSPLGDYANQSGQVAMAVGTPVDWAGSASGGTLARLRFEVQPEAASQSLWPVELQHLTLSSDGGFALQELSAATTYFVGAPVSYGRWQVAEFGPDQAGDPEVAGPAADPDRDTLANAFEFLFGSAPLSAEAPARIEAGTVEIDGVSFPTLTVTYRADAIGFTLRAQESAGLEAWTDIPAPNTTSTFEPGDGTVTWTARSPEPAGSAGSRFLRLAVTVDSE